MSRFKAAVLDTSLFRRCYIICLFFCNITMLIVPAYIGLAVMFCWGSFLVIYNEIKKHTALKTRHGLWLILFLFASVFTLIFHISSQFMTNLYNVMMILHAAMCFFIFYGIHTEKHLNFRREFYSICSFIVYATTVMGVIGLACLMAGIRVEVFHIGFIIFENRFTGMYESELSRLYLGIRDLLLSRADEEGFYRDLRAEAGQPHLARLVCDAQRNLTAAVRLERLDDSGDRLCGRILRL